jgi:hypothetical protein
MPDWLIATPAWGIRHVEMFTDTVLPAIMAASVGRNIRFIIHTDEPRRIKQAIGLPPHVHRVLPLPKGIKSPHVMLGECHRAAIAHARRDECIAFISADTVPSIEVFEAAERRFVEGKRIIMMAGSRTLGGRPPIGASSRDLLRWTMDNRHPIINACFWGSGHTSVPSLIFFERDDEIVLRAFHLHPFAVLKDRELSFKRKTIDADLPDAYTKEEIHVVTDADEAALAEMSPPAPHLKTGDPLNIETVVRWAKGSASPVHRWFFEQRIAICGKGEDIGDGVVCNEILQHLG